MPHMRIRHPHSGLNGRMCVAVAPICTVGKSAPKTFEVSNPVNLGQLEVLNGCWWNQGVNNSDLGPQAVANEFFEPGVFMRLRDQRSWIKMSSKPPLDILDGASNVSQFVGDWVKKAVYVHISRLGFEVSIGWLLRKTC